MELVIDIGNSRSKLGSFERDRCVRHGTVGTGDTKALIAWLEGRVVERIAVGSVGDDGAWTVELRQLAPLIILSTKDPSPLLSDYTTLATLGIDRLANAVGVHQRSPDRTALAIDLGSCITYDLVSAEGRYLGGAISPGMHMR
jgi:type III pantothenate kinase